MTSKLEEAARALLADYDAGVIFNREEGIPTLGWPEMNALRTALTEAEKAEPRQDRPSVLFRPRLSIDGNQWCALYGDNLQDGVAGFGDSPEDAMRDFDHAWGKKLEAGR